MGFAQESGYTPLSIETIMASIMANVNTQFGTTYTMDSFMGTNMYKYAYAQAQRMQESEVKTSEIFAYLQDYFRVTNERISRPVVTNPGLIAILAENDYLASVKKPIDADAGKVFVCVDADDGEHARAYITITDYAALVSGADDTITVGATAFVAQSGAATEGTGTFQAASSNALTAESLALQINEHATAGALVRARATGSKVYLYAVAGGTAGNSIALSYTDNDTNVGATVSAANLSGGTASASYAATKLAINTILKDSTVAGVVTQGTESSTIVLSNGQSFDFKYNLPYKIQPLLRLTITTSENNQVVVLSPTATKQILLDNIADRYSLGKNFEPQRYFSTVDAPWASNILLEWSDDGGVTYNSTVYDSDYDELFEILLLNVELVEV